MRIMVGGGRSSLRRDKEPPSMITAQDATLGGVSRPMTLMGGIRNTSGGFSLTTCRILKGILCCVFKGEVEL